MDTGKLSPDAADMFIEVSKCISIGIVNAEPCSKENTTPTTLEEFARGQFVPAFNATPSRCIVCLYRRAVLLAIIRIIPKKQIAEDILEKTYLQIWNSFELYNQGMAQFYPE